MKVTPFDILLRCKQLSQAADQLLPGQLVQLTGLWGAGVAAVAAGLAESTGRCVLLICRHLDEADDAADDVACLCPIAPAILGAWEVDSQADQINNEVAAQRIALANQLQAARKQQGDCPKLIIAPVMALLQPLPDPDRLDQAQLKLARGEMHDPDALAGWLVDHGYQQVDQVDQQGEFARRGGILDLLAAGTNTPVRIEFFGDQIESIRQFDLDTQRSIEQFDGLAITTAAAGMDIDQANPATLVDYLPEDAIVIWHEYDEIHELASKMVDRARQLDYQSQTALQGPQGVFDKLDRFAQARAESFGAEKPKTIAFEMRSLQKLSTNTHEAMTEMGELADHAEVWIYCENHAQEDRFNQLIHQRHPELDGRIRTAIGSLSAGFHWPAANVVLASHHEIFHRHSKLRRIRRVRAGRPLESLLDLTVGDHVVHIAHGIAKFEGLRQLERDGTCEEYLTLRFADNALLHVPTTQIDLIQKYIGSSQRRPTLSKLGGSRWARQKARVAEAVKDLAAEMLRVQAMRQAMPGTAYPLGTEWQQRFADEFAYSETEDQIEAIDQIDSDMAAKQPMDRLLCGDVGYGKTELAMRAAFRVAETGKQVGVLVPTTVLASQHFRTFTERFADYPFRIELISRFRTQGQQKQIVKDLAAGKIDILIGTHRLLSDDVKFPDLGLAVIDEEQRFGVEHKDHLKSIRATVDVLTMTATPIPRTMHMALLGLRDISSLATPPMDRRAIHTEVRQYDQVLIRKAIARELNRQGQIFFVHNRVGDIESIAQTVRELAPDARVAVGHGQMPEGQLEKTMLAFVEREIDVLVCTTIIESGLDIPAANTMIIHDADRFGLAQLHQLRGRVGRYKHRAYCYLLLPETRTVSPDAAKRLKAVEEFSDLGAGFQIAMRDLEIRGAGNILGPEQSGHIATVGYELYCQLLEQTVSEMKGETPAKRPEVHLELGVESYIPRSYMPIGRQRMEIYRRLSACRSPEDLKLLSSDLKDAYGQAPEELEVLLDLAEIRLHAAKLGVKSIIRMDRDLVFTISDHHQAGGLFENAAGTVRLPDPRTAHWRLPGAYWEMPTLIVVLLKQLRQARQ